MKSAGLQIETIYPLSPVQEALLWGAQSVPWQEAAHQMQQFTVTITKAMDVASWEQAWQTLVDRHAVLRTAFVWERLRQPVQVVQNRVLLQWQHCDLSDLDEQTRAYRLQEILRAERQFRLDWKKPPLMRCAVIRMAVEEWTFVWSYQQIILDAWSARLLLIEAYQLYESFKANLVSIQDQRRPYRDYVLWSRRQPMSEAETFWRAALEGVDRCFRVDRPFFWSHATKPSEEVARERLFQELKIAPSILSKINRFKREHNIALMILILGAWGVVLARKLRQREVVFGISMSGRSGLAGVESMIGRFSTVQPIRAGFGEGMSILEYLKNLQQFHGAAQKHEYASFASMLDRRGLAPARVDGLVISYDDAKLSGDSVAGLNLQYDTLIEENNFAATLAVAEKPQPGLRVFYDSCAAQEIAETLRQIENLLERFATSAWEPIQESCLPDLLSGEQVALEGNIVLSEIAPADQRGVLASHPPGWNGFQITRDREEREMAIPKLASHRDLPLSFGQQRLWFLDRLSSGDAAYNVTSALRLRGKLDHDALQGTLNEIVRRHETLRTKFQATEGVPSQSVAEPERVPLPIVKLEGHPESERESEAMRLAYEEGARPFDLSLPSPFRTVLVDLGPQDNLLVMTLHHIVCDGWSSGLMTREFGLLYDAYTEGKRSPLPELPIQYADFAVWQRSWLNDQRLEEGLRYWRRQLSDASLLQLPLDRPQSSGSQPSGAMAYANLDGDTLHQLKVLARSEGATLFMALLSAFNIVLHILTWQEDIAVGTDVANRTRPEVEPLIGFFTNQVVLRSDLSGNPDFQQILKRVRATTLDAYRHQEVPFDKVVQNVAPAGRSGPSPFSPVKFVLQNFPLHPLQLCELTCEVVTLNNTAAKLPLLLTIAETGHGGTLIALEYDTRLFYGSTADRLLRLFQRAITEVVKQPKLPLHSITEKLRSEEMEEHLRRSAVHKQNLRSRLVEGHLSSTNSGI